MRTLPLPPTPPRRTTRTLQMAHGHDHGHGGHEEEEKWKTPGRTWGERLFVPELLRGMSVTMNRFFRNLFGTRDPNTSIIDRKGTSLVTTVRYPEEKVEYPPGYRG